MIRIAVLSYWHVHAPDYTAELQALPDVEINVVWDEDPERGRNWARDLDAEFVPTLHGAVNRRDVDAVVVTAPTTRHEDVIVAAAEAGKHIFTEKVLAATDDAAERIEAAVRAADVCFCISYPRRTAPGIRFAKRAIDRDWLGQVTMVRSRVAHIGGIDGWLPDRFYDPETCGGGAMIDLGAHPMYTIEHLLGMPERVTARYISVRDDVEVEDNSVAVMEYGNGGLAVAESSFTSRHTPFSVEVHGTEGTLWYGLPDETVSIHSRVAEAPDVGGRIVPSELPDPLPSPIEQWIGAIRGGDPPVFDIESARRLTTLMAAANASAREQRPIELL